MVIKRLQDLVEVLAIDPHEARFMMDTEPSLGPESTLSFTPSLVPGSTPSYTNLPVDGKITGYFAFYT